MGEAMERRIVSSFLVRGDPNPPPPPSRPSPHPARRRPNPPTVRLSARSVPQGANERCAGSARACAAAGNRTCGCSSGALHAVHLSPTFRFVGAPPGGTCATTLLESYYGSEVTDVIMTRQQDPEAHHRGARAASFAAAITCGAVNNARLFKGRQITKGAVFGWRMRAMPLPRDEAEAMAQVDRVPNMQAFVDSDGFSK